MRHQLLRDVNDDLISTGRFLKGIADDPHRLACLEAFSRCQNVVSWLKEVTTSKYIGKIVHSSGHKYCCCNTQHRREWPPEFCDCRLGNSSRRGG